jgi:hypothetical protein
VAAITSRYGTNTPVPNVKARWNRLARKSFGHAITDLIIEYNEKSKNHSHSPKHIKGLDGEI